MDIKNRIRHLPKEIQDLISEFNVEHRSYTRKIQKEYFSFLHQKCPYCHKAYDPELVCNTDYFICQKYKVNIFWCGDICFEADPDTTNKNDTKNAIDDYLKKYSIQEKIYLEQHPVEQNLFTIQQPISF